MKSRKPPIKSRRKPEKLSKRELCLKWGVSPAIQPSNLRYQNPLEKGIYWYHISLFVRQRDVKKYGTCISCGREITIDTAQAGHFMPAKDCGRDLLFDLTNVNAECASCNGFDETHLLGYAENLDKRYGVGTALSLRNRRQEYKDKLKRGEVTKDWKKHEYETKIQYIQKLLQGI